MSFYVYLQKNKKYGAVDNMTRTAKMSSAALRQYTRKNTITMTKWHEIKKSTRDGAVACDAQSQTKAVNHIYTSLKYLPDSRRTFFYQETRLLERQRSCIERRQ